MTLLAIDPNDKRYMHASATAARPIPAALREAPPAPLPDPHLETEAVAVSLRLNQSAHHAAQLAQEITELVEAYLARFERRA